MKRKGIKKIVVLLLTLCIWSTAVPVTAFALPAEVPVETGNTAVDTALKKKAKKIVNQQVKPQATKKAKLKKLFKFVEKKYGYARAENFKNSKGWEKTYAKAMYNKKQGSCYHFAAAFAFLAKQATGYPVRIVVGQTNGFSGRLQAHAWTEVKMNGKWYVFDTNMDKFAAKSSLKYFKKLHTSAAMKKVYGNYKSAKYINVKF